MLRPRFLSIFLALAAIIAMLGCTLTVDKRQTINNNFPADVTVTASAGIGTSLVHNDQSGTTWASDTQAEQALEGTANVGLNTGDPGSGVTDLGGAAAEAIGGFVPKVLPPER